MSTPSGPAASGGSPPTAPPAAPLSPGRARLVIGGVMTGMMLSALDQTVVSTALPHIASELGGLSKLPWTVTAYLVASMVVTPLWGKFSDMYGRRPVFLTAIGIFLVGSALCGVAQDIGQLIAARAVQGIGGGGLFALSMAVVGDVVPPDRRGRYQGLFGAVFGLASVGGPVLGGALAAGPGWRWIFWVNLPVGLVSLVMVAWLLRLPVLRREHRVDYAGATTIVVAVAALLLYLNWAGEQYGWAGVGPLLLVAAAAVLAVLFVLVERRAAEPVIPMTLFANPVFRTVGLFGFLAGLAMFSGIVFIPVYLQVVAGMSATAAGLAMLPVMLGIVTTTTLSGHLISRTGRYKIHPVTGAGILVVAMVLLTRLGVATPYWWVALVGLLFGLGAGLTMQPVLTAVQNAVEPRDMGAALGAANFFQRMGSAVGTAVLGAVFAARLAHHLRPVEGAEAIDQGDLRAVHALADPLRDRVLDAYAHALTEVFWVGVPFVVAAFVVALFLKDSPARDSAAA